MKKICYIVFFSSLSIITDGQNLKNDKCELINVFLNDSMVIKGLGLDINIKDTLFIIDPYYHYSGCKIITNYNRVVWFERKTNCNFNINDFSDEKNWKNRIWLPSINICNDEYSIYCYRKYDNRGGTVIYQWNKNEFKRVNYSIGDY